MAISFPLASPLQFGWSRLQWGGMTNTSRGRNPWTLQDIVQVFEGEEWFGRVDVLPQDAADGRRLAAWVTSLRGTRGTFLLGDPAAVSPLGSAKDTPGVPVVDGAGQEGATLAVRGLPLSAAGYLLAGDYIQLGTGATARLHKVLLDVDSDGSGDASIEIFPALHSSPGDGAAIVVDGAQGVFALTRPATPWNVGSGLIYDGVTLDVRSET